MIASSPLKETSNRKCIVLNRSMRHPSTPRSKPDMCMIHPVKHVIPMNLFTESTTCIIFSKALLEYKEKLDYEGKMFQVFHGVNNYREKEQVSNKVALISAIIPSIPVLCPKCWLTVRIWPKTITIKCIAGINLPSLDQFQSKLQN